MALVFALACLIAYLLYRIQKQRGPAEFEPHGNLWVSALGARPPGMALWATLHLEDERVIEGGLHSYSLDQDPQRREICLARPLRITQKNEFVAQWLPNIDRVIVSASKITFITVMHVPAQGGNETLG